MDLLSNPGAALAPLPVTPAQLLYLARETIFELVGEILATETEGTLHELLELGWTEEDLVLDQGFTQREIAAYRQASEDLAKARTVLEESAAFVQLQNELAEKFPMRSRQENQKAARVLVADAAVRQRAAEASGVWAKLHEVRKADS